QVEAGGADGHCQMRGRLGVAGFEPMGQADGRGRIAGLLEILIEAGEVDRPSYRSLDDLRADPATAHEQSLVDEVLDRLSDRRSGQTDALGHRDLVLQPG